MARELASTPSRLGELSIPDSPPVSPSSAFYSPSQLNIKDEQEQITRAQLAANYLQDLEMARGMNTIGEFNEMNWNEESVNLEQEIFGQLGTISPDFDDNIAPEEFPQELPTDPMYKGNELSEMSQIKLEYEVDPSLASTSQGFAELNAEFEAILQTLPANKVSSTVLDLEEITTLAGINGDDALFDELMDNEGNEGEGDGGDEDEEEEVAAAQAADTIFGLNLNEGGEPVEMSEDYEMVDTSAWSPNSSRSYTVEELDEDDQESSVSENILDALLKGDLNKAQSFMPISPRAIAGPSGVVAGRPKRITRRKSSLYEEPLLSPEPVNKPEKRGRKPSSATKALSKIKDKKLRKKEQNKTAATRYRNKKKNENLTMLQEEQKLEKEHNELLKEIASIASQIETIKPLLLACMLNKAKQAKVVR